MDYRIKEVAKLAGISVRTLHYYDECSLLVPSQRSSNGYRLYSEDDLMRLQQIMLLKELDFSIKEIKGLLDNPNFDYAHALKKQRELLLLKRQRIDNILNTLDDTLAHVKGEKDMNNEERFEAFDMEHIEDMQKKYKKEVEEKYSKEVVDQCNKRTSSYGKKDWEKIQGESNMIFKTIADHMEEGFDSDVVQENVALYHQHIDKYFYDCPLETYEGLGQLYVCDERFTAFYEKIKPNLATFMRDAIQFYCNAQRHT